MDDYISREGLISKFKELGLGAHSLIDQIFADGVYAVIDTFPAADVEPVRHSYWESYETSQYMGTDEFGEPKWRPGRFYVCYNHRCRRRTVIKSNYCPNCGAKMDGGAEDG